MTSVVKILVAVDFSEYSEDTVEVGGMLAHCLNAELVALNVFQQRLVEELRFIEGTTELLKADELVAQRLAARRQRLEGLLKLKGVAGRVRVEIGVPWQTILEVAEEEGAEFVITGTKGRGDLSRTILGSNADKIYRHSPVTLISVRGRRHRENLARILGGAQAAE